MNERCHGPGQPKRSGVHAVGAAAPDEPAPHVLCHAPGRGAREGRGAGDICEGIQGDGRLARGLQRKDVADENRRKHVPGYPARRVVSPHRQPRCAGKSAAADGAAHGRSRRADAGDHAAAAKAAGGHTAVLLSGHDDAGGGGRAGHIAADRLKEIRSRARKAAHAA